LEKDAVPAFKQEPGKMPRIHIPHDPTLWKIKRELSAAQGALAVWGIHAIDTENPEIKWIPVSKDDEANLDVFGWSMNKKKIGENDLANDDEGLNLVLRTLVARKSFQSVEIPLEFNRRGREDYYYGRYIEAVYDFYFVFEYLYADGKFKTSETKRAFLNSKEFTSAIEDARSEIKADPFWLNSLGGFRDLYLLADHGKVIDRIISVRGLLHHQSLTRKAAWNPNLPDEYIADATFFRQLAHHITTRIATDIVLEASESESFLKIPMFANGHRLRWVPME
jgi:hypothetical protein